MRIHLWNTAITAATVSALWWFRNNAHVPWHNFLRDPSILALGLVPLLYVVGSAVTAWLGPRLAYRRNKYLVDLEAHLKAEKARLQSTEIPLGQSAPNPNTQAAPSPPIIHPFWIGFLAGISALCAFSYVWDWSEFAAIAVTALLLVAAILWQVTRKPPQPDTSAVTHDIEHQVDHADQATESPEEFDQAGDQQAQSPLAQKILAAVRDNPNKIMSKRSLEQNLNKRRHPDWHTVINSLVSEDKLIFDLDGNFYRLP